jgi:hypothetical protein
MLQPKYENMRILMHYELQACLQNQTGLLKGFLFLNPRNNNRRVELNKILK